LGERLPVADLDVLDLAREQRRADVAQQFIRVVDINGLVRDNDRGTGGA
jgi:ribosome-binding ATPase YchF (GTP1/OBG family)